MKIPYVFQPYETLAEKEERLAHEEMEEQEEEEEEEEGDEMEIEEEEGDEIEIKEEEDETSLESIDYPLIHPPKPFSKTKRRLLRINGFLNDPLVRSWIKFHPR